MARCQERPAPARARQFAHQLAGGRIEHRRRLVAVGGDQRIAAALQLREIFDAFADAALKRLLQGGADAGDADKGTAAMPGIGDGRIELRPERDEAGRLGRRQLEDSTKL